MLILQDKIFISTRPAGNSKNLARLFERESAVLLEYPMIETVCKSLSPQEEDELKNIDLFHWLIFTSTNGIIFFFECLKKLTGTSLLPQSLKIGVIGKKTEETLNNFGYQASFKNPGTTSEDFANAFLTILKKSHRVNNIFLSLGNLARTVIEEKINTVANCTRIDVYETISPVHPDKKIKQQIECNNYHMLLFTSPSGLKNFMNLHPSLDTGKLQIACIGKTTANAAESMNIKPVIIAKTSTEAGLFESILLYYKSKKTIK